MNLFKPTHPSDSLAFKNKLIRKIHGIFYTYINVTRSSKV